MVEPDSTALLDIAWHAGQAALNIYRRKQSIKVTWKGDDSPMTLAVRRVIKLFCMG